MQLCYSAIGRAGGKYTALELPPTLPGLRKTIKSDWVMGISVFGKDIDLGNGYYQPANMEHFEFGLGWVKVVQGLVDRGEIRSNPTKTLPGGFEGIMKGLDMLRRKVVSGEKLVVRIA